jgi:uncharacterized protein
MLVHLDQVGDEPFIWKESLVFARDELGGQDLPELGEVACNGRLRRTTPGIFLEMSLVYDQGLACTRCLKTITVPVDVEVAALILVKEGPAAAEAPEQELQAEDLGVLVLREPRFDTRKLVIEQIELQIPMNALCREDCAGLCPNCGTDRNLGTCECQKAVDPRWTALAEWKKAPP